MSGDDARNGERSESAVHRLLMDRGAPDALVRGGLPGLVEAWAAIVASVEGGYALGLDIS